MKQTLLAGLLLVMLIVAPLASAQNDKPTIAILRLGISPTITQGEKGLLDLLQAYELINAAERETLDGARDLRGEHINVFYRDAGHDIPTITIMIEDALDREVDAMVTFSAKVSVVAANITREMDDPPTLIFSIVSTPFFTGIADAPCIKDDHIAGTQIMIPYGKLVELVPVQDPEAAAVGIIVNHSQPSEVFGMERIAELSRTLDLTVVAVPVQSLADLPLALDTLIDKGIDALVMPAGYTASAGMPIISRLAAEESLPVFVPVTNYIYGGATVAAGFYSVYMEGVVAGQMLVAHLNGDVDLSRTGINQTRNFNIAVNLDAAAAAGIALNDALLSMADWTIENGESGETMLALSDLSPEERRAADLAYLANLYCADDIIAEQKRRLETNWND